MLKISKIIHRFCTTQTINKDQAKISKFQLKNFSDSIRLILQAGNGGNGCFSFYTDKNIRRGAPDGGCGGKGGDIILQAHSSLHDLSHLRRRAIHGNDGGTGGPRGKDGKNGGKTVVRVPCGTIVYQVTGEDLIEKKNFIADLDTKNKTLLAVKGGYGGKGNKNNPSMNEQSKFGNQGERIMIHLELKTLADVGLVGFPNIGKSTFLAAVSRALPKIANYEFTTLKPSIGYVKFVDNFKFTVADIPGIIEDAHKDKGLGLQFLKHIERTKVLLFVLDITSKQPLEQLAKLQNQVKQYKNNVFQEKHKLVAFNKMDCLPEDQAKEIFKKYKKNIKYPSFLMSAKEGEGVGQVLVQIKKILEQLQKSEAEQQK